ncbi:aldehyde dehydrogenase family protein [Rhodovulum visakhapatnamense]|uniref:Aldehyde dehydrogenase family protein n=3 Tax=Rhodovulum visakhapatnamense TaxID=364297 RepID=A0ABS1RHN2_9RHOB|nr:aldehyde dehydrogenase family protein [Rhodovulum visakhapatnamense]MBL3579159.1 aldehyde dehydrogenase family protein [Rhodovulum visakhapatnamense]
MPPTTLDRGPGRAPDAEARAWIARKQGRFGPWIGEPVTPDGPRRTLIALATGTDLAELAEATPPQIADARAAAGSAQADWAALSGPARAVRLRVWAEAIEARAACLTQLLALETGRPVRHGRTWLAEGRAALRQAADQALLGLANRPGLVPLGIVAPGLSLGRIGPALAAGNAAMLAPGPGGGTLAALCLAEAAAEAGLPAGLLTVLTGPAEPLLGLARPPVPELGGPCLHLVLEDADLDAAADAIAEALGNPPPGTTGQRLLVQDSVAERVHSRLAGRMARLIVGDPLDPATDLGPLPGAGLRDRLTAALANSTGTPIQPLPRLPDTGLYFAPALIPGLAPASPEMETGLPGPVLLSTTFRSPAEAILLANAGPPAPSASLWSETLAVALDLATALEVGTVCVNGTDLGPAPDPLELWQRPAGLAPARPMAPAPADRGPDPTAALTAARRVQPGWAGRGATGRAAVLARAAARMPEEAAAPLAACAARAATACATWSEGPGRATLRRHRPLGLIAALCPAETPALAAASILGPVLAAGNAAVLLPHPGDETRLRLLVTELEAAGLPAGLVQILSGAPAAVALRLAARVDLDALWCCEGDDLPDTLPVRTASGGPALWLAQAAPGAWSDPGDASEAFLRAATRAQTIRTSWGA